MSFTVVIPARYQSQRLPGKPLIDLAGKPIIQWVYEQAIQSSASHVVVATDDQRIAERVGDFGGEACITRANHPSGTDRIQEVCQQLALSDDQVVVNVQGDEPLIPPALIDQVAEGLTGADADMATLCEPIDSMADVTDPNIVKVVIDGRGRAMYFSRAPIPWARDEFSHEPAVMPDRNNFYRHVGIYAYRVSLLNEFVTWPPVDIETTEKLEQLRALWHGAVIHVGIAASSIPPGIDTEEDLKRTLSLLEGNE